MFVKQAIDKTRIFYENLRKKFAGTKVTRELFDLVFTLPPSAPPADTLQNEDSRNPYRPYDGKIVGNIYLKKLPPFGTVVTDTSLHARGWANRANKLHMKTRDGVLLNNLLLEKGERIQAASLGDNERIIRQLPFIRDARLVVQPRGPDSDTVDILLVTKDVFAYTLDVRPSGLDQGSLTVGQNNLLGLGHELDLTLSFNPDLTEEMGYEAQYQVANIRGSFIRLRADIADTYWADRRRIRLNRSFLSPNIKYAGGIEVSRQETKQRLRQNVDEEIIFPLDYDRRDVWFGRGFRVNRTSAFLASRSQLVLAGRLLDLDYTTRPEVTSDTNRLYRSTTLYLASLGISYRQFYRSTLVYGFGRTEDIPTGYRVNFITGKEQGDLYDRWYHGVNMANGTLLNDASYLRMELSLGGFFNRGDVEQGALIAKTNFFSSLLPIWDYRLRQFVTLNYTNGIRRFNHELISLEEENGIRGLRSFDLRGSRRFSVQLESIVFTPYAAIGFNLAPYLFADMGFISNRGEPVFEGQFYQGFGFGVRIRNENLAFKTFHLRFAFYPNAPRDASPTALELGGTESNNFGDFDIGAPEVLPYR
ncbi:hypothetical protein AB9P05_02830 [Roseivirga sp. BDSF3-8]|uniref:hypothetical protein n=1 Tax=Roseivirga sp. BDSF3-8 TaxID=3241598 RepID=UPI0035327A81